MAFSKLIEVVLLFALPGTLLHKLLLKLVVAALRLSQLYGHVTFIELACPKLRLQTAKVALVRDIELQV